MIGVAIKHEMNLVAANNAKGETLLSMDSLYEGLKEASKTKLDTVIAEYPKLKTFIYRLKGKKPRLKFEELREMWSTSKKDTTILINNLIKVGFFKNESDNEIYTDLLVPIIFRPALSIQYQ
jgi:DNA replication protein DnaD